MIADLKEMLRRYPVMAGALALFSVAALAFLVVSLIDLLLWEPGLDRPMAGWMTVGYVAHAWGLDPREVDRRAGLPRPEGGRPFTLSEAARMQGVPVSDVIDRVQETVDAMMAERQQAP